MGQTASLPHTCSAPCPCGARQRRPNARLRRRQAPAPSLPPSAPAAAPTETKRSAHAPCSWGMGASARSRRRWKPALRPHSSSRKAASLTASLRRRRQVPARGPAAVYSRCHPSRNETQRPCPLLVGHGRVCTEPKALEAGTAGWASGRASPPCSCGARNRRASVENAGLPLVLSSCAVLPIFSVQGHAIEPQLRFRSRNRYTYSPAFARKESSGNKGK